MLDTNLNLQSNRLREAAMAAPRQMWLAGLGAAVVTRDWMQSEAGAAFKALVKEGTVVESRAIRVLGDRIESSVSVANMVWKEARRNVESTVKQAAGTAVSIAQQVLPTSLPKFELPTVLTSGKRAAKTAARTKRTVKVAKKSARTAKVAKKAKRAK